jgi:hypothetical protein
MATSLRKQANSEQPWLGNTRLTISKGCALYPISQRKRRPACDRAALRFQLFDTAAAFGPSLDLEIIAQGAGGQLQATLIRSVHSGGAVSPIVGRDRPNATNGDYEHAK